MPQIMSRSELHSILEHLGKALHTKYDKVVDEHPPIRWVDLILYLDEKERQQSGAAKRRPEPPPEY
jgi:hypothetical protein